MPNIEYVFEIAEDDGYTTSLSPVFKVEGLSGADQGAEDDDSYRYSSDSSDSSDASVTVDFSSKAVHSTRPQEQATSNPASEVLTSGTSEAITKESSASTSFRDQETPQESAADSSDSSSGGGLSIGAKAGIGAGAAIGGLLVFGTLGYFISRWGRASGMKGTPPSPWAETTEEAAGTNESTGSDGTKPVTELDGTPVAEIAAGDRGS